MMRKSNRSIITAAAFLMATSAIGPGFLTQTTVFTERMMTSFGFVILVSAFLDVGAQLNIWRIITVSRMRAQDLANRTIRGSGTILALLIVLGGIAFNVGNIAGAGLGIQALTGLDPRIGGVVTATIAIGIFLAKNSATLLDIFVKVLGVAMILVTAYIAIVTKPPVLLALQHSFVPEQISFFTIVTVVGGTVGGYISFAGAHRLLDAGIAGPENTPIVTRSSILGIVLTSVMRYALFLAVLGVVWNGFRPDSSNPVASIFVSAAGDTGRVFFGLVIWCASITSIVGATFTSVTFLKTLSPVIDRNKSLVTSIFIVISSIIFLLPGSPVNLLIYAGAVNGFILPFALAIILVAARRFQGQSDYHHPFWMWIAGWVVVVLLGWMSLATLAGLAGFRF